MILINEFFVFSTAYKNAYVSEYDNTQMLPIGVIAFDWLNLIKIGNMNIRNDKI